MKEVSAIPNSLKRRHLVITGSLSCKQSFAGVCAHRYIHDVGDPAVGIARLESFCQRQLVVRIERRRMAACAG